MLTYLTTFSALRERTMQKVTEYGNFRQRSRTVPPIAAAIAAVIAAAVACPTFANNFAPDIEVNEGSSAQFAVTLPHGMNANIRWSYQTEDGTATSQQDYTTANGHLGFAAGDTTGEVAVSTLTDSVADDGETFKLRLHSLEMQRANGQWSSESIYGFPSEKTITATIRE